MGAFQSGDASCEATKQSRTGQFSVDGNGGFKSLWEADIPQSRLGGHP